jgi:membrane protein involved in colicin uptake
MDQKLEDIDPDARKKYDKDMKQQAKEALRRDALHLSNDDFGSKYGRDRTAKETAARSANETAGYKAAETDARKELMNEGLRRASEEGAKQRAAEKERDDKAKAERKAKNTETAKRNAADTYRTQMSQQSFDFSSPSSKGGGGGGGGIPKVGPKRPTEMKKGGMVSSASKRADGIATKGKTKGRMV